VKNPGVRKNTRGLRHITFKVRTLILMSFFTSVIVKVREKKRLKENCYKLFLKINNEHEDPTFKDTHK
jgi:hypothetical protein